MRCGFPFGGSRLVGRAFTDFLLLAKATRCAALPRCCRGGSLPSHARLEILLLALCFQQFSSHLVARPTASSGIRWRLCTHLVSAADPLATLRGPQASFTSASPESTLWSLGSGGAVSH